MSKIDGAIKEMLGEKQRDYWCQMEEPRPSRRTGQDSEPDRVALEEGNPRARQQGRVGAGRDTRSWKSSHRAGQNPLLMQYMSQVRARQGMVMQREAGALGFHQSESLREASGSLL